MICSVDGCLFAAFQLQWHRGGPSTVTQKSEPRQMLQMLHNWSVVVLYIKMKQIFSLPDYIWMGWDIKSVLHIPIHRSPVPPLVSVTWLIWTVTKNNKIHLLSQNYIFEINCKFLFPASFSSYIEHLAQWWWYDKCISASRLGKTTAWASVMKEPTQKCELSCRVLSIHRWTGIF